jgi:hypothetical protein
VHGCCVPAKGVVMAAVVLSPPHSPGDVGPLIMVRPHKT